MDHLSNQQSKYRIPDPIIDELWKIKQEINKEANYQIDVLVRMAHEAALAVNWNKEKS